MKKKLFLLVLSVFIVKTVSSQTIKTVTIDVSGGKLTYSYYEDKDTFEEIRHGDFKFVRNYKHDVETLTHTINGRYNHGFRDGVCTYILKKIDVESGSSGRYRTGETKMVNTFTNGMPNGKWSYVSNYKSRCKEFTLSGWKWSNYASEKPDNIQVTFKNGALVGAVLYQTSFAKNSGNLDDDGFMVGEWIIDGSKPISFYKRAMLDKSEGLEVFNQQKKAMDLTGEHQQIYCDENRIIIDTINTSQFFNLNDGYFNSLEWLNDYIRGDKTVEYDEYGNATDLKDYGRYLSTHKVKLIPIKYLLSQRNIYNEKLEKDALENILENYDLEISKSDRDWARKRISELNEKSKNSEINKERYELAILKLDTLQNITTKLEADLKNLKYPRYEEYAKEKFWNRYNDIEPERTDAIDLWDLYFEEKLQKRKLSISNMEEIKLLYPKLPEERLGASSYLTYRDEFDYLDAVKKLDIIKEKLIYKFEEIERLNLLYKDAITLVEQFENKKFRKSKFKKEFKVEFEGMKSLYSYDELSIFIKQLSDKLEAAQ